MPSVSRGAEQSGRREDKDASRREEATTIASPSPATAALINVLGDPEQC